MPSILERYQQLEKLPAGRTIFSILVGLSAPFFGKIRPKFIQLKPAYCETQIKDRWGVRNHLGTINAGALCSMAEMTGGLALDSVVPSSMRWIPRSMQVDYLAKATGTITAISQFDPSIVTDLATPDSNGGDVVIPIEVTNKSGDKVFRADITFYLSPKPARQ